MAHFALLWKARTIEKYRQNYENEKYLSIQNTNTPIPQKSLSQRLRCYRQDTQKRFSRIFQKIYPEGSSLSNFFLYLRTDQTCLTFVLKSLLGFFIGLALTYLCFLFLVFQLSISLFHATIVSSIIGVLLTMGLAFSYRIRCLIFLLLPQFFSRAGRYTLTCYALVLILTGPATNTLKNSEVLSESMACRQEQIKTLVNEVKQTMRKPLNSMKDSIQVMVQKIHLFARQLKLTLMKVNKLTLCILETIQSTFSWLQWLSEECNIKLGSPYNHCMTVLKKEAFEYERRFKPILAEMKRLANKVEEVCSYVKNYNAMCMFTDFVNGSFVASIRRRLRNFSQRIREMLYLQIHVHHSYSFSSNTSHSASQVAAGIVTEIRKRADPLLTWLSWSSCVTSLFLLLIIFRAKYYQHMFETRSRFDNKYITKEIRDLDLSRLRHGRETILPLNKRERSKYVSTTSFRLVASEKIHLNRSIVFMAITTFKLLIHMVADYSLYWVLMTIRYNGKNQTPLPHGVPYAGMHIAGTGHVADMFRTLLAAITSPLETAQPLPATCLPNPNPPDFQRYTQIGVLIFLLWFFSLFEPYGLRLRHVVMGLYRPERAKARAEWLYNHILRTRGGFMKFARRKLHRSFKYSSEEKYTFKRWLNDHIPFYWLRKTLGISEEPYCLLCRTKESYIDSDTKLQKCNTINCPGMYCENCFSDIGQLCTICMSPSDYGDLSDVSLEKGSSDESDEDPEEGSLGSKNVEEDSFYRENYDILLPKPLRDCSKIEYRNFGKEGKTNSTPNNMTGIEKQTVDRKKQIVKTKKIKIILYMHLMKYKLLEVILHWLWKISNDSTMRISQKMVNNHVRQIKDNDNQQQDKSKYESREISNRTNNEGNISKDNNVQKESKRLKNNKSKRDKENECYKFIKLNQGDNERQDKVKKSESKVALWCFNNLSTVFSTYWHCMKENIFNNFNSSTRAVISSIFSSDKENFKTRKKDIDVNRTENNLRIEREKSRQYRIYTYLAEQEWVINKTMTYNRIDEEDTEKPDIETIKCLKRDIYAHQTIYLDDKNQPPVQSPILKRHASSEDCKLNEYPLKQSLNLSCNEVTNINDPTNISDLVPVYDVCANIVCKINLDTSTNAAEVKIKKPCVKKMLDCAAMCCLCKKIRKKKGKKEKVSKQNSDVSTKRVKKAKKKVKANNFGVQVQCKKCNTNETEECVIKSDLNQAHCIQTCSDECQCEEHGVDLEKCDPLCPDKCTCEEHSDTCIILQHKDDVIVKNCANICTETSCGGDNKDNRMKNNKKSNELEKSAKVEKEIVSKEDCQCQYNSQDMLCNHSGVEVECQCPEFKSQKCADVNNETVTKKNCQCQYNSQDILCNQRRVEVKCQSPEFKSQKCAKIKNKTISKQDCQCQNNSQDILNNRSCVEEECQCSEFKTSKCVKVEKLAVGKQDVKCQNNSENLLCNQSCIEVECQCSETKSRKYPKVKKETIAKENCQCQYNSEDLFIGFDAKCQCSEYYIDAGCAEFCSCAIQCSPLCCGDCCCILEQYDNEEVCSCATECCHLDRGSDISKEDCRCNSQEYSDSTYSSYPVTIANNFMRSDISKADVVFYKKSRKIKPRRYIIVTKRNQCVGTDKPVKYNVGTITNERGLMRKHILYQQPESKRVKEQSRKQNRGVCTATKLVAFKSRVNIIPSRVVMELRIFILLHDISWIPRDTTTSFSTFIPSILSKANGTEFLRRRAKRLEESYNRRKPIFKTRVADPMFHDFKYKRRSRKSKY